MMSVISATTARSFPTPTKPMVMRIHRGLCATLKHLSSSTRAHPQASDDPGAGTWDHPFLTIQAAIDRSSGGAQVLVYPGTYVENLNFHGKAISVISTNGPMETIIDGNGQGRVVAFVTGESRESVLEGFTITNGQGGVYIDHASPTLSNCRIVQHSRAMVVVSH